ncbi:MAG: F0F1 ATP synthase subunit B [Candidatus Uhrbacteria bacterium]
MGDLLTKLGIDWKLLLAQLVNFLILFFVLRRFLFKPMLAMLAKRRERIEEGLEHAKQADHRLAHVDAERKEVLRGAEMERSAVLEKLVEESVAMRKRRTAAAEQEAQDILANARKESERERAGMLNDAQQQVGTLVLAAAQKVTAGAISDKEHGKLIEQAVQELKNVEL